MPDFSALTQQQAISAQIPYKNLALSNPAETFLNAWQMATNVKLKQQELTGKMAALAAKNHQLELDSQLDRAKFGLAIQKADIDATHKGNMYEIAAARLQQQGERDQNELGFRERKYNEAAEGKDGLIQIDAILDSEGLKQGYPGYLERFNQLTSEMGIGGKIPNNIYNNWRRGVFNKHDNVARERQQYYNSELKHFGEQFGSQFYGDPLNPDLTPLLHPERLKKETTGWGIWGSPTKETGNYIIPGKDAQGTATNRVISQKDIDFWSQRHNELENFRKTLAPTADQTGFRASTAQPMPSRKEDAVPNNIYSVPGRGDLRWTGTDFVPP